MEKRKLALLSFAFIMATGIAFTMNGNTKSNNIEEQLTYYTYENNFDNKCGDGKCGDGKTTKEVIAKKEEKKGKCGDGKTELDTKASKITKDPNAIKATKLSPTIKDGKCGDGKASKEDKTKSVKKEKCGSGKCGDGK